MTMSLQHMHTAGIHAYLLILASPSGIQFFPEDCAWNERFQRQLSVAAGTPEEAEERRCSLEALQREFASEALPLAQKIIEEENSGNLRTKVK